jgi:hypothetical protein
LYCLLLLAIVLSSSFGHYIVYFFWSLYCLLLLAIVLSTSFGTIVLSTSFGHCIVYFFWTLYCLLLLAIVLSTSFGHCIVYTSAIYGFWLPLWYLRAPLDYVTLFLIWRRPILAGINNTIDYVKQYGHVETVYPVTENALQC